MKSGNEMLPTANIGHYQIFLLKRKLNSEEMMPNNLQLYHKNEATTWPMVAART